MSTLHMLKSATDTICESFIFQSKDSVVVIDGGFESESEILFGCLKSMGGTVDAWFFTHPHDDHYGAFCQLMTDHGDEIKVKKLYFNFLDDETLYKYDPGFAAEMRRYLTWMREHIAKYSIEVVTMHTGDVYPFGEGIFRVLREPTPSITENFINNASTVFRLDVNGKRVMFLGDLGIEGGRHLLETVSAEELKSDYVQMAHHGQKGVERDVYEAIHANVCLWCTPTWLWDNMGPEGYDTGNFKTVVVRGWMSEIRAKKHYVNMNGPFKINL